MTNIEKLPIYFGNEMFLPFPGSDVARFCELVKLSLRSVTEYLSSDS